MESETKWIKDVKIDLIEQFCCLTLKETGISIQRKNQHYHQPFGGFFYTRWLANSLAYQLHNLWKNFKDSFSTLNLDILCWLFANDSLISVFLRVIIYSRGHCVEKGEAAGLVL